MKAAARPGGAAWAVALALLAALGLGGVVFALRTESARLRRELDSRRREYDQMLLWKRPVEEGLKKGAGKSAAPDAAGSDDLLPFLDRKRAESGIPQNLFNLQKNNDLVQGGWRESSYTVTLRSPNREAPVPKGPIVDFLRKVEDERPGLRVKTLSLSCLGNDFSSAIFTLSTFTPVK
jgi:hypothetical protein